MAVAARLPGIAFAAAVRERAASPLRTLANLLEAMREGDYSIRARGARVQRLSIRRQGPTIRCSPFPCSGR